MSCSVSEEEQWSGSEAFLAVVNSIVMLEKEPIEVKVKWRRVTDRVSARQIQRGVGVRQRTRRSRKKKSMSLNGSRITVICD